MKMLQQLYFGGVLIVGVMYTALTAKVLSYVKIIPKFYREVFVKSLAAVAFSSAVGLSPWIQVKLTGRTKAQFDLAKAEVEKGEVVCLLTTHASYLDALLLYKYIPQWMSRRSRTIASGALRNVPLLGLLCEGCGHIFLAYKKSSDPAKFSLDEQNRRRIREEIASHLAKGNTEGGVLFFAPEGCVNPNPKELLPFRTGGMRIAIDHDSQVWAFVFVNNEVCWPKAAPMGGLPAKIAMDFQPIFPDPKLYKARAIIAMARDEIKAGKRADVRSTHDDDHDAALLAAICREKMQADYDKLTKDLDLLHA